MEGGHVDLTQGLDLGFEAADKASLAGVRSGIRAATDAEKIVVSLCALQSQVDALSLLVCTALQKGGREEQISIAWLHECTNRG